MKCFFPWQLKRVVSRDKKNKFAVVRNVTDERMLKTSHFKYYFLTLFSLIVLESCFIIRKGMMNSPHTVYLPKS